MFTVDKAHDNVVYVRWRTNVPASGYDLWDGGEWMPISRREFNAYYNRGFAVHMNPRWSGRC